MGSAQDSRISTSDGADQKQQPPAPPKPRQQRVSFAVGPDDHPLLVVRKRMKAGETRHSSSSLRTFGKSESFLMDEPGGQERLRHILERVQADDTLTHLSSLLTPRGEDGIALSPPHTPPTPGRRHDITWDQEAPLFFPLRLAAAASVSASASASSTSSVDSADLKTPSPKRKSDEVSLSPRILPNIQLRPRFESPWLAEKLGLPPLSEDGADHELRIPFAPFTDDDDEDNDEDDSGDGHVDKKTKTPPSSAASSSSPPKKTTSATASSAVTSATAKLAGMNLSVSAAAERSNLRRRRSMNARSA